MSFRNQNFYFNRSQPPIMNAKDLRKIKREEGGIGLFSREQQKNTTPFQYSMQIAVGTVFIALGTMLFYQASIVRTREIRHYGSADTHVGMWLTASAFFAVGAFFAHVWCDLLSAENKEETLQFRP
jgi:hypothetical protein